MDATRTLTVTAHNAVAVADEVNALFAAGTVTTVYGSYELASRFGSAVAKSWQNGTVSVTVKARTKGKTNELYVKVGHTLTVA